MCELTILQQADKEMKEIYNSHFPEAKADDLSIKIFTKQEMNNRYVKAYKFWKIQAEIIRDKEEKDMKDLYKLKICAMAIEKLNERTPFKKYVKSNSEYWKFHKKYIIVDIEETPNGLLLSGAPK